MMLTHRFGSAETLTRAEYWLTRHGFTVEHSEAAEHDQSRLVMRLELPEVSAALALIDSIERSDPAGWPGLLDRPATLRAHEAHPKPEPRDSSASKTPIHWQAAEHHPATDPLCCKVCEYMLGRWE